MARSPRRLMSTSPFFGLVSSGVLVLMVAGCGGTDSPTEVESPPIAVITVTPGTETLLARDTRTFTATREGLAR